MKLLFLDVDGVLNNLEVLSQSRSSDLGEGHLRLLKTLVAAAGCDIVLTSTWRLFPESQMTLRVAFEEHGIPVWIDATPHITSVRRAEEILSWLRNNTNKPVVAVGIDDDEDIDIGNDHGLPVKFKPLKTDFVKGLTASVVQEAIDWFSENDCTL